MRKFVVFLAVVSLVLTLSLSLFAQDKEKKKGPSPVWLAPLMLALFLIGAACGLIGDHAAVDSAATRYLDTGGVPFIWDSPIFFPASPFTLEHSVVFGKQRDYANISDQFRPETSTQRAPR